MTYFDTLTIGSNVTTDANSLGVDFMRESLLIVILYDHDYICDDEEINIIVIDHA